MDIQKTEWKGYGILNLIEMFLFIHVLFDLDQMKDFRFVNNLGRAVQSWAMYFPGATFINRIFHSMYANVINGDLLLVVDIN